MRLSVTILAISLAALPALTARDGSALTASPQVTRRTAVDQAPASDQGPARDVRKPRTGTGRIVGRVVSLETGAPIRRAAVRISLTGGDPISQPGTTSDADGNFEFTNLPTGSYAVFASKSGYLAGRYGAPPGQTGESALTLGKSVALGEGERATGVIIQMARGGAISGRILDEFGDPITNTFVQLWRRQSLRGVRRLVPAGVSNGGTDDLGRYRIYGLEPGTYYLSATTRNQGGPGMESGDGTGYAPTYYPGTPSVSDAQPIELGAGQDVSGVDFMLVVARLGRVSGIVVNSSGRPLSNAYVTAMIRTGAGSMGGSGSGAQVQADGSFTMTNLPPAEYTLMVRAAGGRPAPGSGQQSLEMGETRVNVAGGEVSGIVIQTSPGSTLSGQVVFDGALARNGQPPQGVRVMAMPVESADGSFVTTSGASGQVGSDGRFVLSGAFGELTIRASAPSGWMLKGIYLNGRDVADSPITVDGREAVSGIQIVFTDRVTHVAGAVTDANGKPVEAAYVVVVPTDPGRYSMTSRYVRTALARDGNPWKVDALPPADYVAVALESVQVDTLDPEFLDRIRKVGVRFSLGEGETKDVPLKMQPMPR